MNQAEFIERLRGALLPMPQDEIEKIAQYYSEYIADAVETGQNEHAVVASLGDVHVLASKLKAEQHFEKAVKKPSISSGTKALIAVLSLFALPIALPVAMALLAVVIGICVGALGIIVAIISTVVAILAGFVSFAVGVITLIPFGKGAAMLSIGLIMILAGLLILLFMGAYKLIQLIIKGVSALFTRLYRWAFKKGGAGK